MARVSFVVLVFLFVKVNLGNGQSKSCVNCQGGYNTNCARDVPNIYIPCMGPNANCYEAVVSYQNGSLPLVLRRCFVPQLYGSTFCEAFNSTVGTLIDCKTCYTDNCNNHNYVRLNPNMIRLENTIIL